MTVGDLVPGQFAVFGDQRSQLMLLVAVLPRPDDTFKVFALVKSVVGAPARIIHFAVTRHNIVKFTAVSREIAS